jgi:hypothetical protein
MGAQVLVWFVMSVCESAYMIEGQSRSEKDNKKKGLQQQYGTKRACSLVDDYNNDD